MNIRRSCASMRSHHTTATDGGSAENAGAIFCPFVREHKNAVLAMPARH